MLVVSDGMGVPQATPNSKKREGGEGRLGEGRLDGVRGRALGDPRSGGLAGYWGSRLYVNQCIKLKNMGGRFVLGGRGDGVWRG